MTTSKEILPIVRKNLQILQSEMVKQRFIEISIPWTSPPTVGIKESRRIAYTLSNLAGHASFFLLALSYLEKDFMQLRIFAASGMSLSIIFQYYREKPLWIPIRWNLLFILINATMIASLLKEEADADSMPKEEKELYASFFERRGNLY